jgi:hypothetical protein
MGFRKTRMGFRKTRSASKAFAFPLCASLLAISTAACAQTDAGNPRQNWGLKPLGPSVAPLENKPADVKRALQTRFKSKPADGEKIVLAQDNRALATLIFPAGDKSDAPSRRAAALLQNAWQKISGVTLPALADDKLPPAGSTPATAQGALISVGATKLASAAGINADDLDADGYRLQTRGTTLFIIGNDRGAGFSVNGTLNGAHALLERHFGYRWLWPGELGEVFPRQSELALAPLNEQDEPSLPARGMRNYYPTTRAPHHQHNSALLRLNRETATLIEKAKESDDWFSAMGLGRSKVYSYGHAFTDWWEKYGATHPEYFALQPDGTRDQAKIGDGHKARLDVSNPQLIQAVANEAIQAFRADPARASFSISPNDGGPPGFCMCEVCRRLDPPNAPKITANFGDGYRSAEYVSLTDRYVNFYGKVAEIVGKEFPDRVLGCYAYSAYRTPPLYAKLPPNVLVGFVGLSYFNEEQRQANLKDWDNWTRAANHLLLRPNALIAGHGFPAVYAHKLGADVKHCYATGMIATDFDSVMHNWSGQGLNYYVLAKLLWDPSQNVDTLIQDYCNKGFGKASPEIQKYFAALEVLTNKIAKGANDSANEEDAISKSAFYSGLHVLTHFYTDTELNHLQSLLDAAKTQAGGDEIVLQRIDFLGQGLRYAHAEIVPLRIFMEFRTDKPDNSKPQKKQELLQALKTRQEVFQDIYDNHFYAQNVLYPLYRETSMWRGYGWNPGNEK